MHRTVTVTAPSRLHCGLFSFGHATGGASGGVGMMIDSPGTQVRLWEADGLEVDGPLADRARQVAQAVFARWSSRSPVGCRIEIRSTARHHTGLGLGTQLGLAVVAGLHALYQRGELDATGLAGLANRGRRSAIGTHGFLHGGLLVEAGRQQAGPVGALAGRATLPAAWRFVLVCPRDETGLCGADETRVFRQLPPVSPEVSGELSRLARSEILPAARQGRFSALGEALYTYGCLAGNCFAQWQGGPFATPYLASLVEAIRAAGVRGVGQSSWGPTLFALLPDDSAARQLVQHLGERPDAGRLRLHVARPNRAGARIEVDEQS